ncbi:MAG: hypothetical protein ACREEB_13130 [Caulobacteraceae bacterium]
MSLDPSLSAGLIGAGVMFFLAAVPFFVGWGSIHATLEALKARLAAVEAEMAAIRDIKTDVAYIRGRIDAGLLEPAP